MESATKTYTVLVDDDTDLLVLLCYHTSLESYNLFFQAGTKEEYLPVYYQVQQWKETEAGLLPQDWGWKESDDRLAPVTLDLNSATIELLRISICNRQTDCSTIRCSCKWTKMLHCLWQL